jgi:ACS family allantoate permease-like MFS transporter
MAEQEVAVVNSQSPELEKQGVSKKMDEAAEFLAHSTGFVPLSPDEEKAMIRKMDWILLPMVCHRPLIRK